MTDDEYNEEMKRLIVRRERFMFSLLKGTVVAIILAVIVGIVGAVVSVVLFNFS